MAKHQSKSRPDPTGEKPGASGGDGSQRFIIRSAREDYDGVHPNGLRFFQGIARTEDPAVAEEYAGLGFEVNAVADDAAKDETDPDGAAEAGGTD